MFVMPLADKIIKKNLKNRHRCPLGEGLAKDATTQVKIKCRSQQLAVLFLLKRKITQMMVGGAIF
jgi:hypothetical protein